MAAEPLCRWSYILEDHHSNITNIATGTCNTEVSGKQGSFHALVSDQIDKLLNTCICVKTLQTARCPLVQFPRRVRSRQAVKEERVIAPPKVPGGNWAQSGSGSQNKRYKIPFPWSKGEAAVTVLISCSEFIPPLFLQCNNTMHFNQSK